MNSLLIGGIKSQSSSKVGDRTKKPLTLLGPANWMETPIPPSDNGLSSFCFSALDS